MEMEFLCYPPLRHGEGFFITRFKERIEAEAVQKMDYLRQLFFFWSLFKKTVSIKVLISE